MRLDGPLKELGLYTVKIHLHHDINAELKVWVVPTVVNDPSPEKVAKAAKEKAAEKPAEKKAAEKTEMK